MKTQAIISKALTFLGGLLLAGGLIGSALAQTTGKITGRVIDAATGAPLPGVSVYIEGTTLGAATDVDGEYVIIGVRPGTYTVVASFVGYATERREGVQVGSGLTTRVDFALREEVIQGEEIVVVAPPITVRKDLTSSEARVTAETIDRLPVQEVSQVLTLQAGVTERGGLHIRGGRASEVVVMVDGVPVTDNFDGSTAVQLENEGIQELQVISGTFNAEYGNAMSGVINVVTKEGRSDRWAGSIKTYSGSYLVFGEGGEAYLRGVEVERYTRQGIQYRDVDPYGYLPINPTHYYNFEAALEGPIFTPRLTLFGLVRYFHNDGWLYGARMFNMDGTYGDSSLVPMNTYSKLSWQGNLRFQVTPNLFLNLIGLGSVTRSRPYDLYWRWNPDGRTRNYDLGYNLKLQLKHLLSARTFYTVHLATFRRHAWSRRFDDPLDPRYNGLAILTPDSIEVAPGVWVPYVTGGGRFARGGMDMNHFERTSQAYFAKADLTSQVARNHLVKLGAEVRIDRLDFTAFSLIPATDAEGNVIQPFRPAIPPETSPQYQHYEDVSPVTASAYVQDKIEFEDFIVNVGLRFDYFDARTPVPADPEDPNIYFPFKKIHIYRDLNGDGVITVDEEREDNRYTLEEREAFWWKYPKPKFQLSPRLGISYPITETGVLHFSYGHFLQIPTLNLLFAGYGYKIQNQSGQYGPYGNPDLDAQRTVMYEIGFRQGLGPFLFDVTAYYRDVRDWVSTSTPIETEIPGVVYVIYTNRDYASTRGVTATFSRRFEGGWGFDVSYTYQVAEGSNSNPDEEFFARLNNQQPALTLLPLDWDQRHKVAAAFYLGGKNWGASMVSVWGSGFPYTPSFPEAAIAGPDVPPTFPRNARRMPSTWQVDLYAYRDFEIAGVRPRLFVQVYNLLDRRNPVAVFSDTGRPDVTLPQQQAASFDPGYFVRPEHYSEPRRLHVGLELQF